MGWHAQNSRVHKQILHTATETYKYRSSFDKSYNASVMKVKKVLSLWYRQELKIRTWRSQPDFFKFCHRDSVPLIKMYKSNRAYVCKSQRARAMRTISWPNETLLINGVSLVP